MKRFRPTSTIILIGGLTVAAAGLSGCASTPPPLAEIARADTAIGLAEQADARTYAPVELDSAIKKLKEARAAMAAEDFKITRRLAEQAQVEAELAQAKAQTGRAQQSVQQVRESIRLLREEVGSGSP
ncbi:MAG: DUF4398 domain-containing protein [Gammaproteobacteria bacterium]